MRLSLTLLLTCAHAAAQPAWHDPRPSGTPGPRCLSAFAFDSQRWRSVLFGGTDGVLAFADTWELAANAWTRATPAQSPPARFGAAAAYDAARRQVVVFGGTDGTSRRNDTWVYDGLTWTQKSPATPPPARSQHAMVWDQARQRVVLFGGQGPGNGAFPNDTWAWDGASWTKLTPPASPTARTLNGLCYDSARDRIVLFGGYLATAAAAGDTWEFDGTTWLARAPATGPSPRYGHALVYDRLRGRTVLHGGLHAGQPTFGDVWDWDGGKWSQRMPALSPPPRAGQMAVWDGTQVLVHGGFDGALFHQDTWTYWTLPPSFATYGKDCYGGTSYPALVVAPTGVLPWTGQLVTPTVFPVPANGSAVLLLGASASFWAPLGPLPAGLGSFGFPGCTLYTSIDVALPMTMTGSLGSLGLQIPDVNALAGQRFFLQALVLPQGPTGMQLSPGVDAVVSVR